MDVLFSVAAHLFLLLPSGHFLHYCIWVELMELVRNLDKLELGRTETLIRPGNLDPKSLECKLMMTVQKKPMAGGMKTSHLKMQIVVESNVLLIVELSGLLKEQWVIFLIVHLCFLRMDEQNLLLTGKLNSLMMELKILILADVTAELKFLTFVGLKVLVRA